MQALGLQPNPQTLERLFEVVAGSAQAAPALHRHDDLARAGCVVSVYNARQLRTEETTAAARFTVTTSHHPLTSRARSCQPRALLNCSARLHPDLPQS